MEKICAAHVMQWSIELENGLRSKKPGKVIESILQTGTRLEQWSKEPNYPLSVLQMFGLIPGEDRLFANTILLRLADAFKSGDKQIRISVLKVFLVEAKFRRSKGKSYNGILKKDRVFNHAELLKRVKLVYDTGDVESKGLVLRLISCWADFAKDSAEIRYMVLSSLGSCHVSEVKASLFAVGCFSELSEDFACIVLEMLINMITSSKTTSSLKLAGARRLTCTGTSLSLANRAYKAGKKLVLESFHKEFIAEMLVALSKLASKSMLLISEQVDLLLPFLVQPSASCVQAIALRCLNFLLAGGVCRFPVNASLLKALSHIVDSSNHSLGLQCEALKLLRKTVRRPCMDISELVNFVPSVKAAAQSPILPKRLLALCLLVDISCDHRMGMEMTPDANDLIHLPSWVLLSLLDQIEGLVKPVLETCRTTSEVEQECRSLLYLIVSLVKEHPSLGVLVLDKIRLIIEPMMDLCTENSETTVVSSSLRDTVMFDVGRHVRVASNLISCVYKVVESCVTLDVASAITSQLHQSMKLLLNVILQSSLFTQDIHTVHLLFLHSHVMGTYSVNDDNEICIVAEELRIANINYRFQHERVVVEYMKNLITGNNNWSIYRFAQWAACQGLWLVVAILSGQLINKVQSESNINWLKSLTLFAQAESTILLLNFPKQVSEVWVAPCTSALPAWNADSQNYIGSLTEACTGIRAASEVLGCAITLNQTFYFQKWFLDLRAKFLEAALDILRFLSSDTCNNANICRKTSVSYEGGTEAEETGPDFCLLVYFLTRFSFRLNRLVREFDLLATSFIGMDTESFRTVSRLAVNCSVLAFCTGFVLYHPNLYEKSMLRDLENLMKCSHSTLLKDAIKRLQHVDEETSTNLKVLLTSIEEPKSCFHLHQKTFLYGSGFREREILVVSRNAVTEVLHLQEEASKMNCKGILGQVSKAGVQLLRGILTKWMQISLQTPKYFFQVRPCPGAELFTCTADNRKSDEISILPGSHLSLNLCLQMKNVPEVLSANFYCVLACKPSYCTPASDGQMEEQKRSGYPASESDDSLDLNEKLMLYVMNSTAEMGARKRGRICGDGCGFVLCFVSFDELNQRGQGFSNCLLDVTAFPEGSYMIKWHSCCIDSQGSYWSLLPLNAGPRFSVKKPLVAGDSC
ncbi:hypothetical protein MKW98_014391 [Papaver atlanticum]|uniref:ARM repeat superfamily protein n=1 Tax=Papaver atlanticum TaxID=357466 RepID=A0AAD4XIG9_9MAGN|nr:hypothetical protein MKW98_014391 [Papaver atlanticum]